MRKLIICLSVVGLLTGCGEKTENKENEAVEAVGPDMEFASLIEMDQQSINKDLTVNKKVAEELHSKALDFVEKNPDYSKVADALEIAAKTAEYLGKYDEAIETLHKLANDYPVSDKTPMYLYNKARILEEKQGKKENAKAAYEDLIKRFPEDPLSISAQQYLDMNYLEMSDEELIKMLEEKNQSAE